MKAKSIIFVLAVTVLVLTGCGGSGGAASLEQNGIILDKEQHVSQVIIEPFDQSYYNTDELRHQIEQKVSETAGDADKPAAVLQEYELTQDQKLHVQIDFATAQDYTAFNGKTLFAGTVNQAIAAGYAIDGLIDTDKNAVGGDRLAELGEQKIVIFEEALAVVTPGRILCTGPDVAPDGEKTAHKDTEGNLGIIVYE